MTGVLVESGTGNSILSNSIFQNGRLGIDLVAPGDPPNGVTLNGPGVRRPQRPSELPGPDPGHVQRHNHSHPGLAQ